MRAHELRGFACFALLAALVASGARADSIVPDDLIVQGGLCVGLDCVNGESFPSDLLRLKENNTRVAFHDTSDPALLPGGDWQITANDSPSGGQSRFSFDDLSAASVPFWLGGGAPTDALYVTSAGRVGAGTAAPETALHVAGSMRIDGDLLVTGGLRAGRVPSASLAPDGTATVSFASPYTQEYAITLTPVLAGDRGGAAVVLTHDANGFTFAVDGKPGDYVEVFWTARSTSEP